MPLDRLIRARPARIAVGAVAAGALFVYAGGWATVTFHRPFPDHFEPSQLPPQDASPPMTPLRWSGPIH